MNRVFSLVVVFLFTFIFVKAQEKPQDFLSSDFHKSRREAVRSMMPENTVAVFFANPVRNRANDVDYVYHQDPDFYYLTGYNEPNSVLIIFSEDQVNESGSKYNELIYVQKRDPASEQWNGKRLGVEGVKELLGFKVAYNGAEFANTNIDFGSFEKVLFFDFKNDVRNGRDQADMFDLIKTFKVKTNYPSDYNPIKQYLYSLITNADEADNERLSQFIGRYLNFYTDLQSDKLLSDYVNSKDELSKKELKQKVVLELSSSNLDSQIIGEIMNTLRETKTAEELKLLKKAVEISAVGQIEVMKAMHPNMSETEIQGVHEFVYKKYGAEYEGYPSIVGGGHNGCILHYIENNKPKVGEDLVLMDLGAEYHGYTADVTRTIPANGKFSPEQRAIYEIVYNAQEEGIKASVIGNAFSAPEQAARKVVTEGLIELGIVKTASEARKYFPHGTSHYLGLDVHDKGTGGAFKENTVITVEPGIYIPEGSECDKKWWGIAVRIEDDILITKDGPVNLSVLAPRKVDEIEKLMAQKSPLDNFLLPNLDEKN